MSEQEYQFPVRIIRSTTVSVFAGSAEEAKQIVKEMYESGDSCAELGDATIVVETPQPLMATFFNGFKQADCVTLDFGGTDYRHNDVTCCATSLDVLSEVDLDGGPYFIAPVNDPKFPDVLFILLEEDNIDSVDPKYSGKQTISNEPITQIEHLYPLFVIAKL